MAAARKKAAADALAVYNAKRNFSVTPEPAGEIGKGEGLSFVVQKHWASRLHYDFRLELDGTMKSWAVPKGPSYDSRDKRMAVQVEDHPISYSSFEGTIPENQYGAGKVIVWDRGTWQPLGDAAQGYRDGNLKFELKGHKLHGRWVLVRMKGKGEKQPPWLLIKEKDEFVRPASEFSVVDEAPDSVAALAPPGLGKPTSKRPAAKPKKTAAVPLPEKLAPQLAVLFEGAPPDAADWVYEIKFDGYRLLSRIDGADIKLFTRNGNDWTDKLGPLKKALAAMKLPRGWYDGEIVVLNAAGVPDFGALQQAFDSTAVKDMVLYLFDAPFLDGEDLRELPLVERRARLEVVLAKRANDTVRFSGVFEAAAKDLVLSACKLGLEGVIGKRRDAPYVSRRSNDWIKLKCSQRQEFVIGGYTDPQGSRSGIGALLLGVYDDKKVLRYAGKVGTGFSQSTLVALKKQLTPLAAKTMPFAPDPEIERSAHWVKPTLVAEVTFGEWTKSHHIRHSVFHGLRTDKPATVIVREKPKSARALKPEKPGRRIAAKAASKDLASRIRVTHPERVIDAQSGLTKLDLVRYYDLVGGLMMEHLKHRPVSLVRAPGGVGGQLFFQKHAETEKFAGVKSLPVALDPGHLPMLEIAEAQGLLSAAQWNVIELHTRNGLSTHFEHPDRMVFDLDPGEDVGWPAVREAATLVNGFLKELGLLAFLKTSGGKGLHVVVPLKKQHGWDEVKDFSHAVVTHLATVIPQRFVDKSGPKNRVGKIFIDYLRNGQAATTACAWSARARPGLGISVPMAWDELASLKGGDHWTVESVHTRLDVGNRPWADYAKAAQGLAKAMKRLTDAG